jgi:hypothetical protein
MNKARDQGHVLSHVKDKIVEIEEEVADLRCRIKSYLDSYEDDFTLPEENKFFLENIQRLQETWGMQNSIPIKYKSVPHCQDEIILAERKLITNVHDEQSFHSEPILKI